MVAPYRRDDSAAPCPPATFAPRRFATTGRGRPSSGIADNVATRAAARCHPMSGSRRDRGGRFFGEEPVLHGEEACLGAGRHGELGVDVLDVRASRPRGNHGPRCDFLVRTAACNPCQPPRPGSSTASTSAPYVTSSPRPAVTSSWEGPTLAAQALNAGLVDECQLFIWPVVLGGRNPALPADTRRGLDFLPPSVGRLRRDRGRRSPCGAQASRNPYRHGGPRSRAELRPRR